MKSASKVLIGVLSVAALIGTGVASWTIGGGKTSVTTETLVPEVATTIGTKQMDLEATLSSGDKLVFDSTDDMDVTYNVKAIGKQVGSGEVFDPYSYYSEHGSEIESTYLPNLSFETHVFRNGEEVTDPEDSIFTYLVMPEDNLAEGEENPISYKTWLGAQYKENGYPVTLHFGWGEKFNNLNPQVYAENNLTPDQEEAFFTDVINALKDITFTFTFTANGKDYSEEPEEPVVEETGEVTIPTVENSVLTIEGMSEGKLPVGEHEVTLTTGEGYVLDGEKITVNENGETKDLVMKEDTVSAGLSTLADPVGHTYTGTYNFIANATYTFSYNVVEEIKYATVTVSEEITGGSVKIENVTENNSYELNKAVNLTVTPEENYELTELYYVFNDDSEHLAIEGNTFTPTSEGSYVVYATFAEKVVDMVTQLFTEATVVPEEELFTVRDGMNTDNQYSTYYEITGIVSKVENDRVELYNFNDDGDPLVINAIYDGLESLKKDVTYDQEKKYVYKANSTINDFNSNGDIVVGDKVTFKGIFNGAKYFKGFFVAKVTSSTEITYEIKVTENGGTGSYNLSKENASYGEEVTLTVTAPEGMKIGGVRFNGSILDGNENLYTFTTQFINQIEIEYVQNDVTTYKEFVLNGDMFGVGSNYVTNSTFANKDIGTFTFSYGNKSDESFSLGFNKSNQYTNAPVIDEKYYSSIEGFNNKYKPQVITAEWNENIVVKSISFDISNTSDNNVSGVYLIKSTDGGETFYAVQKVSKPFDTISFTNDIEDNSIYGILAEYSGSSSGRLKITSITVNYLEK